MSLLGLGDRPHQVDAPVGSTARPTPPVGDHESHAICMFGDNVFATVMVAMWWGSSSHHIELDAGVGGNTSGLDAEYVHDVISMSLVLEMYDCC